MYTYYKHTDVYITVLVQFRFPQTKQLLWLMSHIIVHIVLINYKSRNAEELWWAWSPGAVNWQSWSGTEQQHCIASLAGWFWSLADRHIAERDVSMFLLVSAFPAICTIVTRLLFTSINLCSKKKWFVKKLQVRTDSVHSQRWPSGCISSGRDLSRLWTQVSHSFAEIHWLVFQTLHYTISITFL